jgi:hypothetical protein
LVRFLISPAAQTARVWYGSLVSSTCAHFSFVCAATPVDRRQREARYHFMPFMLLLLCGYGLQTL